MTAKCISLSGEAADQGETYRFYDCTSETSLLPILSQLQGIKLHIPVTSLLLLKWQETNSMQKEKYMREKQLLEHEQNTT